MKIEDSLVGLLFTSVPSWIGEYIEVNLVGLVIRSGPSWTGEHKWALLYCSEEVDPVVLLSRYVFSWTSVR